MPGDCREDEDRRHAEEMARKLEENQKRLEEEDRRHAQEMAKKLEEEEKKLKERYLYSSGLKG